MSFLATDCARAREAVSIQLDGELPELELDRLTTHLRFCPECEAWAEQVRDVTLRLREATLEVPAERLMLPGRGRSWRVGSAVAVTSAAALVATMFFASGQHGSGVKGVPQVSGFVGVTAEHFTISRVSRLEDGVYVPVSMSHVGFRPV